MEFGSRNRNLSLVLVMETAFRIQFPLAAQNMSNRAQTLLLKNTQSEQDGTRPKGPGNARCAKGIISRRQFLREGSGTLVALLAMNSMRGRLFDTLETQAAETVRWVGRTVPLQGQFVFDAHTNLVVPDDYGQRRAGVQISGMDPNALDTYFLPFENYVRQIFLNSDTTVSVLSVGTPFAPFSELSDSNPSWEFLNSESLAEAAEMVNQTAGRSRMLAHAVITPGEEGWFDEVNGALREGPPAGWTLYDCQFRLDDERLIPFYERAVETGVVNLGISRGLTPRGLVRAATKHTDLNFIIYGDNCQAFFKRSDEILAGFEETGLIEWCADLSEIPAEKSLSNIYVVTGATFASTIFVNPRLTAAILGTWIKVLGPSNVLWGTGSIFHGSPQWQIEAFRRLEIPLDMQQRFEFSPLGPAGSPVKNQILGLNSARLYTPQAR